MSKNKIKGNDIKILITQCPKLYKLKIEENKIESPNIFFCLKKLNLRKLNIKGNPVCNKLNVDYRKELFNHIKTLEAIDDLSKNNETIESTEYGENEEYCEKEDFQSAESAEEDNDNNNNKEENKNGGNDEDEEEYENEDEHYFDEERNDIDSNSDFSNNDKNN